MGMQRKIAEMGFARCNPSDAGGQLVQLIGLFIALKKFSLAEQKYLHFVFSNIKLGILQGFIYFTLAWFAISNFAKIGGPKKINHSISAGWLQSATA